jgi:hypothetical protein
MIWISIIYFIKLDLELSYIYIYIYILSAQFFELATTIIPSKNYLCAHFCLLSKLYEDSEYKYYISINYYIDDS